MVNPAHREFSEDTKNKNKGVRSKAPRKKVKRDNGNELGSHLNY